MKVSLRVRAILLLPAFLPLLGAYANTGIKKHAVPRLEGKANSTQRLAAAPQSGQPKSGLAQSFGVAASTCRQVEAEPQLASRLEALPSQAKELYKNLSMSDKVKYNEQIHGKTSVGFMSIDNKKAFIDGTVMGHDVFSNLRARLDQDWMNQKVSDQEYVQECNWFTILAALTPDNRAALVSLLEMDTIPEAMRTDDLASH